MVLEGEAGSRAFGLFVVENKLPKEVSTRVAVGPLVDPDGQEIPSVLRFEPGVITLAPGEQVVAKVSAHISRGLVAGVRYQGEISVPGIAGARIPIIVRRKPTTKSAAVAAEAESSECGRNGDKAASWSVGARRASTNRKRWNSGLHWKNRTRDHPTPHRLTMNATAEPVTEISAVWELPQRLGLTADLKRLRASLAAWVEETDPEVRHMIQTQLSGRAKYFRPVTIFACYRSMVDKAPPDEVVTAAAGLELLHNVSLIVDDILDRSRYRRGNLSLHCRYGFLPGLMTSGYIMAAASKLVASDAYSVALLAELMQRLGVAECLQWRLRRHALGTEDWRMIAGEDTGSMFEICARLGTRDNRLQKFGRTLGMLYHGCDDVADVRGTTALGGGSAKDIEDAILTLPVAIAVRDPETALLFRNANPQNRACAHPEAGGGLARGRSLSRPTRCRSRGRGIGQQQVSRSACFP